MVQAKVTPGEKLPSGLIINQITVNRVNRQILDIAKWRNALTSADYDRMTPLFDLYEDMMVDGRLWDAIDRRIRAVTGSDLTFQDKDGEEVQEMIDLIDTDEFEYLLYEIMKAAFWGVTLVQLDFTNGMEVFSVPRKHIRPKSKTVALMQNDTDGAIAYDQLVNVIEVVNKKDPYGLILRAAPYVIMMRGGIGDWAQMVELFGMPQRVGKYSIYDQEARKQLEEAFLSQGAAASIVIPKETDVETNSGSGSVSSGIYKDFIDELKEAMLVTVLSNTMTTLDGSSRAQGEVHQDIEDEVNKHDLRFVQRILNKKLKPILEARGYKVADGSFVFPKAPKELSVEEVATLCEIIEIPAYYVQEKWGIPQASDGDQLARKAAPVAVLPVGEPVDPDNEDTEGEEPKDKEPPKPDKTKKAEKEKEVKLSDDVEGFWNRLFSFFPDARTSGSRASALNLADELTKVTTGINIDRLFNLALRNIYRNQGGTGELYLEENLFNISNRTFQRGIDAEFGAMGVEFGKKNEQFISQFKDNAVVFAAFKTHAQMNELQAQLMDSDGNLRSFYEFKKAVLGTTIKADYNQRWLLAEYNIAVRAARVAAQLKKYQETKDIYPNLEYMPSTAATPRAEHALWYGTILPMDHPWWQTHMPPSEWGCECSVRNTDAAPTAVPEDDPDEPVDPVFKNNPADTAEFVNISEHPYVTNTTAKLAEQIRLLSKSLAAQAVKKGKKK